MIQDDSHQLTQTGRAQWDLNEGEQADPVPIASTESSIQEPAPGKDGTLAYAAGKEGETAPAEVGQRAIHDPTDRIMLPIVPPPAPGDGDAQTNQTLTRLLKLEEVVRNLVSAQSRRSKSIEDRVESLQEALMTQVAGIETHYRTAISTAELKLTTLVNALKGRIDTAEAARLEAERRAVEAEAEAEHVRAHLDTYRQVWQSAPLTLRLKFVRELLPDEHQLQAMLKEASALEDLRKRGRDLETWVANYPSLFADAMQSLESGTGFQATAQHTAEHKIEPVEILAIQTLEEAKSTLSGTLQALGITWIAPAPGDMVQSEHEVIGEEVSPQPEGRIASLRRRGFRVQGRAAMPAQVTRAVAAGSATGPAGESGSGSGSPTSPTGPASPTNHASTSEPPPKSSHTEAGAANGPPAANTKGLESTAEPAARQDLLPHSVPAVEHATAQPPADPTHGATAPITPITLTGEMPDWLRMLVQRTHGCESQPALRIVYQIVKLVNLPGQLGRDSTVDAVVAALTEALVPLLPLLGLRYADGLPGVDAPWGAVLLEARDPLISWLRDNPQVNVIAPIRGQKFDPQTMEAIETRRTVHESENDTVSRVDHVGLQWRDRTLVRAGVVRYVIEGAG
jgi:molecular chaperone GrpE (heat shock protein)